MCERWLAHLAHWNGNLPIGSMAGSIGTVVGSIGAAQGCATGSNRGGLSGVVLKILKCQPWSIAVMGCALHPVCVAEFYWKMDHERRQHHKDQ